MDIISGTEAAYIRHTMNSNLHKAKKAKNDEFYTQLSDIENELKHYKSHFNGKTVFLNCDDPKESNFFVYFAQNFQHLGLKKLISTHYRDDKPSYKLEIVNDENNDGKINALDTITTPLKQNGDFRSDECIDILEEADIVVTNPPFSLFREYIAQLISCDKKFIIVGSDNAITYKETFSLIKEGKLWLGDGRCKQFVQPDGSIKKFGNIGWFTNLDHKKRNEEIILYKTYNQEHYPKYDNYDAINIDKVADIPVDYNGVMGVPISFLTKHNPSQFSIVGLTNGRNDFEVGPSKRYVNAKQVNVNGSIVNGSKANTRATLITKDKNKTHYTADNADGLLSIVYARILIKRK